MYGPFGNLFPYSDQHALNLDWIIQVAKDFLDQYTHIQEIITNGETSLDQHTADGIEALAAEKTRLEGLLNAWYITHSEDIAGELTTAIASFRTAAEAIGAEVIASIPVDYTTLENAFDSVTQNLDRADITSTISDTSNGVTRLYSSGNLVLFGTATAARRLLFLNGQNSIMTTTSAFKQTLPAGTYSITSDMTGAETTYNIEYTYTTFANSVTLVRSAGPKNTIITFTNPVMIGFTITQDRNYGTSEAPSTLQFNAVQLSAIDFTARENVSALSAKVSSMIIDKSINYGAIAESPMIIPNDNEWFQHDTSTSKTIPIPGNALSFTITALGSSAIFACLKSYDPVVGDTADYSTGWGRTSLSSGGSGTYEIGSDCKYLYVTIKTTAGTDITPSVSFQLIKDDGKFTLYPIDSDTSDETGKTDRTSEIQSILNTYGCCEFMPGIYYVSGDISMPAKTTIKGVTNGATIKLLNSATNVSTIVMSSGCTIKDITIRGKTSTGKDADNNRNGIEWTGESLTHGTIYNCIIMYFDGAGILMHDTSDETRRNLAISDCYITGCRYGIDIKKNSEFHKIDNCTIVRNYYGIRNRGGNNNVSNCGLDSNTVGIQIDADEGSNNGHGTITGCSINHSDSNTGYGIVIKDTGRMIISNCNLYYSSILLDDTNGNLITGCGFGQSANWDITDGECNIFNGCMVRGWTSGSTVVTITNNTDTKIVNCFDRDGTAYS